MLNNTPFRFLLEGEAMTKKTWWAGRIAEAGYNVIYLDGDGNPQVLERLTPEAKARVTYVNCQDFMDNGSFGWFLTWLFKGQKFYWDQKTRTGGPSSSFIKNWHEAEITEIDPAKLTRNDFIVIDSWTAFVNSLQQRYMREQNRDIENRLEAESDEIEYRWTGKMADTALAKIKALPCNICIVAHTETITKVNKKREVVETKYKVISTSRNQAEKLWKFFTDIFHFKAVGTNIYVSTENSSDIVAGSRTIGPFRDVWDKFTPKLFFEKAGVTLEAYTPQAAVITHPPGTLPAVGSAQAQNLVIPGVQGAAKPKINLGALLRKG